MDGMRNRAVRSQLHTFHADAPLLLSQARQNFILPKSRSEVSSFYLTRSRGTSEFVKYEYNYRYVTTPKLNGRI